MEIVGRVLITRHWIEWNRINSASDPDAHERRRTPYIRVGCSLLPIIGDWLPVASGSLLSAAVRLGSTLSDRGRAALGVWLSMDHEQFVKEYRGGRDLSAGEVLGIGFGLFHLMRIFDCGSVTDPNPLPPHGGPLAPRDF